MKTVPVSLYSTDNDDKHLQLWHSTRRSNCFQAPSPILPTTKNNHNDYTKDFDILSQSINNLPKNLESALSSHSATHLHPSVQCLILNISSPTGEMVPKAPSSFCTQFFKSRTSSDAKLCFTNSMRKDFNCHVDTDNSVITNIYNGQFLCEYVDVPSNFSAFAFPKQKPTTRDEASKMIAMKLKVTHGKGLNDADIKSALKQSIILPNNIEDLHF